MIPMIKYGDKTICFMADLLPSAAHIPLPYIMAYYTRPRLSLQEKEQFLKLAVEKNYILFLEHDPVHECATLQNSDRGPKLDRTFSLAEI